MVERDLEILNPTSHEKLMLLADYCDIRDGARVLDIGSGKGYMLRQWAKRFGIEGTGLEINRSFVLVFSEPKNASRRTVDLPQRAVEALRSHRKRQAEEQNSLG